MKNSLCLILAFIVFSGFSWGGGNDDKNTKKATPAPATSSYNTGYGSSAARPAASNARTATANAAGAAGITKALQTENPDQLKERIESLARVSRALQALNQSRGR